MSSLNLIEQWLTEPALASQSLCRKDDFVASPIALVVDDNKVNQMTETLLLKKLGFIAHTADNGAAAVEAFVQYRYKFILMDCQMPIADGFMATRAIRNAERYLSERVAIIACTSTADAGDCFDAGMDDYLPKPVAIAELQLTLARLGLQASSQ